MTTPSKATTDSRDQQILQGIQKDLQTMTNLQLGGSTYTPGSLAALVQSRIDAATRVDTTKASWQSAVRTYQAIHREASAVVRDLRNYLLGAYGDGAAQLADFGFVVPPPRPKPEPRPAVSRQAATRKARRSLRSKKATARRSASACGSATSAKS